MIIILYARAGWVWSSVRWDCKERTAQHVIAPVTVHWASSALDERLDGPRKVAVPIGMILVLKLI